MAEAMYQCRQLQRGGRSAALLQRACPVTAPTEFLGTLGARVRLARGLAAAGLADALQQLSAAARAVLDDVGAGGTFRGDDGPAAEAADAFQELAAVGAVALLASALREMPDTLHWWAPADVRCLGCTSRRIRLVTR